MRTYYRLSPFVESIDPVGRKHVIYGVITNLREYYVTRNLARKMVSVLLAHERAGDYPQEMDRGAFAELLTEQLQEVSHDRHLRVSYDAPGSSGHPLGPPENDPKLSKNVERDNCTFQKVEILPHNIAYLKFNAFPPIGLCRAAAERLAEKKLAAN